jgi:hypothetical protein
VGATLWNTFAHPCSGWRQHSKHVPRLLVFLLTAGCAAICSQPDISYLTVQMWVGRKAQEGKRSCVPGGRCRVDLVVHNVQRWVGFTTNVPMGDSAKKESVLTNFFGAIFLPVFFVRSDATICLYVWFTQCFGGYSSEEEAIWFNSMSIFNLIVGCIHPRQKVEVENSFKKDRGKMRNQAPPPASEKGSLRNMNSF